MPSSNLQALETRLQQLRGREPGAELARTLVELAWETAVHPRSDALVREALELARQFDLPDVVAHAHCTLAHRARMRGAWHDCLDHAEAARIRFEVLDDLTGLARTYEVLVTIHDQLEDHAKALEYAHLALKMARRSGDRPAEAWAIHSIAYVQGLVGNPEAAIAGVNEACPHFEELGILNGLARCAITRGFALIDLGRLSEARDSFLQALQQWAATGSIRGLAGVCRTLAELCLREVDGPADLDAALTYATECIDIARTHGVADMLVSGLLIQARCHLARCEAAAARTASEEALVLARQAISPSSELEALELLARAAAELGDHERAYHHLHERLERDRAWQADQKVVRRRDLEMGVKAAEAVATDRILHTVLPAPVVQELKLHGAVRPRRVEAATVLFTDLVGFTAVASRMRPEVLVEELQRLFGAFDAVVRQTGLERLKTIGDAYMAVAGVPVFDQAHVFRAVVAALGFREAVARLSAEAAHREGGAVWQLRIGLHTGPLVAGMIGRERTAFDVWGDTVNIASRMESNGQPGRINVSEAVFRVTEPYFLCEDRGKLPVKNRGDLGMAFVDRLRPEWSDDEAGVVPNEAFWKAVRGEA
ncbi:MAG: adenylate/guanylate cyclase domain-containing protein [bacterium]|nr:adenylate/guanylate cyclase domain-containing protein [bacterium]